MKITKTYLSIFSFAVLFMLIACERDTQIIETISENDAEPTPYFLDIPSNFQDVIIPADNPLTYEGIQLGRKLFYDPILSKDNTQSCSSCHSQEYGFTDHGNSVSVGVDGIAGTRNSMAIINLGYNTHLFWDGRELTLEDQAHDPVVNPIEMNSTWPDVLAKLNADSMYVSDFRFVFGVDVIDSVDVMKAIAQFERTLISGNSKYDKHRRGETTLSLIEIRGEAIFNSEAADCFHCHGYPYFMSSDFHNNGVQHTIQDSGRARVTGAFGDIAKFKAPTLRNIAVTGPYMHDGRFQTLEEVVEFYNSGVDQSFPTVDPFMRKSNRVNGSLGLSDYDKQALVAFLHTLTDTTFLTDPRFSNPN